MNARPGNLHDLIVKLGHLSPQRVAEVEDFVEFLAQRDAMHTAGVQPPRTGLVDPPVDNLGAWPADLSLRREDLYGDDER